MRQSLCFTLFLFRPYILPFVSLLFFSLLLFSLHAHPKDVLVEAFLMSMSQIMARWTQAKTNQCPFTLAFVCPCRRQWLTDICDICDERQISAAEPTDVDWISDCLFYQTSWLHAADTLRWAHVIIDTCVCSLVQLPFACSGLIFLPSHSGPLLFSKRPLLLIHSFCPSLYP